MISFKQIRYALAVAEHGHFKRAAEASAISQSALSGAISDMETQLGFKVFERDNKKVLITPLGQELLRRAARINLDVKDLHALANKDKSPMSGRLKVGMIPTIAPYLLPLVLPKVRDKYPELSLSVEENQSHILLNRVKNGDIDSAILALPYECEGLLTLSFWQEDFFILADKKHKLAGLESITSRELGVDDLLLLQDGHCLKEHALAVCHLESKRSDLDIRANSLTTLVHLVANGMGTTLVPEIALQQLLQSQNELSVIKLNEPSPHRELAFVVRQSYPDFDKLEHLRSFFKAILLDHFT